MTILLLALNDLALTGFVLDLHVVRPKDKLLIYYLLIKAIVFSPEKNAYDRYPIIHTFCI